MTGDGRALAFARRISERTSLDCAALRTFICCSEEIAILYHSSTELVELGLNQTSQRDQAFFVSIELGPEYGSSTRTRGQAMSAGRISISDLRHPRIAPFKEGGDWVHLYLPVNFVAKVQRIDGSGSSLFVREPLGRPCPDIQALAKALEPILRNERPHEELFVDNIVLACTHLIIERYLGQRSATAFEHNQMSPARGIGFISKLL